MADQTPLVMRMRPFGTTIFSEMTELALRHEAANLGQGFPDHDPPAHVLAAAHAALDAGRNQYAPGPGVPKLRAAIADHQQRHRGLTYDPDTEISVTFGATEAVAATLLALCERGDEVLLLDPAYDAYVAAVALADAVAVRVPFDPPQLVDVDAADAAAGRLPSATWRLDLDRVADAVTPRTRAIVVNTPHNPTGRILSVAELDGLAAICVEHDLVAVTDEVYEHLVHDPADAPHVPLASRPGMAERTVTISSAGKTLACTGWKVGWACAPPALTAAVRATKQFLSFSGGTPLQFAVAAGLRGDERAGVDLATVDGALRDAGRRNAAGYTLLRDALVDAGVPLSPSAGTYFLTIDVRSLGLPAELGEVAVDGAAFCRWAPEHLGVAAVPISAFCAEPGPVRSLIRLAVCKREEVLRDGIGRLIDRRVSRSASVGRSGG